MNYQYINTANRKQKRGPSATVIRYEQGEGAPKVVAQGSGSTANRILNLAKQHDIPLQEDETLLTNLMDIELGDQIPPQLYGVIAEILLFVKKVEDMNENGY
ncbi:EscU/YscU/HrcU family type III secretion system export apparatus switch protein [Priestia flexa]|uniref:EscU/YscU/HrcU family type III secretion system export apparatus switch protein n=1 Tax=Priestia flexa TaxID=86664 RepID=UPI00209D30F0|nr:EscU/YscU/HrcU family type III secretion system export apparatus switch protein [Priestia flexa]MCP1191196.1 EscU/YscU/HrcU family type III secretion system export apparatus switch protein [Priestia flexa]